MTDNEIIKALEDAICRIKGADNLIVPKEGVKNLCCGLELALDLINRQKAEIERLKNEVFAREQECIDMQEQRDSVEYNLELLKQEKSVVKAEAYKEFAERLKEDMVGWIWDFEYSGEMYAAQERVNDLLKELEGEQI